MAGHHSCSVAGVKAYLQNVSTGLYLNNKGWWSKQKVKVSFPSRIAVMNYAERNNATYQIIHKK